MGSFLADLFIFLLDVDIARGAPRRLFLRFSCLPRAFIVSLQPEIEMCRRSSCDYIIASRVYKCAACCAFNRARDNSRNDAIASGGCPIPRIYEFLRRETSESARASAASETAAKCSLYERIDYDGIS